MLHEKDMKDNKEFHFASFDMSTKIHMKTDIISTDNSLHEYKDDDSDKNIPIFLGNIFTVTINFLLNSLLFPTTLKTNK